MGGVGTRFQSLDALRGIAALFVVFHHLYLAFPEVNRPVFDGALSLGHILVAGRPMVIFFFVLSGFVLTVSLEQTSLSYSRFVTRRIFRIYVPFAAAVLASTLGFMIFDPRSLSDLSPWFNVFTWSQPLTPGLLLGHLAMVGTPQAVTLNSPMWSLVVEMRWSLLFPLLLAATTRTSTLAVTLFSLVLTFSLAKYTSLGGAPYFNHTPLQAVTFTLYFMSFFVLGIALAQRRTRAVLLVRQVSWPVRTALWFAAAALLSGNINFPYGTADLFVGIGGAILITLALETPEAKAVLGHTCLQWLGRVSYSLYLFHVVVLAAMVHALYDWIPLGVILAAVIPVSLVVAHLGYIGIERPAMAVGYWLTRPQRGMPLAKQVI